jgi:hypothetical protein
MTFRANYKVLIVIGIEGIMIGKSSTTAQTPRAHITNMATMGMETLNDRRKR